MSDRVVLSIDCEFFTHTPAYRQADGTVDTDDIGRRGVEFLLSAFEENDINATFFIVGKIAEQHPELVEAVDEAGHEIGSHSYSHTLFSDLDEANISDEFRRSRSALRGITDQVIAGFRAPAFDLAHNHFSYLDNAGYEYDSSIMPSRTIPGWYGGTYDVLDACLATQIDADAPPNIFELPVSVMPGLRLPLSGAWFRLFGRRYTEIGLQLLSLTKHTPVLYFHPWEFVDLPRIDGIPYRVYWRTGSWMRQALRRVLERPVQFVTASSEVAQIA